MISPSEELDHIMSPSEEPNNMFPSEEPGEVSQSEEYEDMSHSGEPENVSQSNEPKDIMSENDEMMPEPDTLQANLESVNEIEKTDEIEQKIKDIEGLDITLEDMRSVKEKEIIKNGKIEYENESHEEEIQDLRRKSNASQEKLKVEMEKSTDIHDRLAKEIEKQETTLKENRVDFTFAKEKIKELKDILDEKETKISELETTSLKNEDLYNIHYGEMTYKISEMVKTIENINERLAKSKDLCEIKEKDIKEMDALMQTKENEFYQIYSRFEDLQAEFEVELKKEFLSLKLYKETIEIEISKNELIITEHSEKFHNMESELELMKINVQNKDVSIVTLNKQLIEEKETLADYISKLNINLDETKKELDSNVNKCRK